MKKIALAAVLVFSALGARAQAPVYGNGISYVPVAPSGPCPQGVQNQQVISTGVQYSCQNITAGVGTWAPLASGGSAYCFTLGLTQVCPGSTTASVVGLNNTSFWGNASGGGAGGAFPNGNTYYYTFTLPVSVTVNDFYLYVQTADNTATNFYDIGIYSLAGTLLVHTGPIHGSAYFGTTGTRSAVPVAVAATLGPGTYAFAMTSNCASACAVLGSVAASLLYGISGTTLSVTTGGTLNTSVGAITGWSGGGGASSLIAFGIHQ